MTTGGAVSGVTIRSATVEDAGAIAAIYAPVVRDTAISFEIEPPTAADMAERIRRTLAMYPFLVTERDGEIVGYAYSGRHRERAAYRWSVDVSIYLRGNARGTGLGGQLYDVLLELLRRQGFRAAFAGIALPNEPSVRLHESRGFRHVGVYRDVGFKHGAWRDVGWWQLTLAHGDDAPQEPVPFARLCLAFPAGTPFAAAPQRREPDHGQADAFHTRSAD